eukprot:scaffold107874_cov28-Tisochrysis_lutea.AAC.5
MIGRDRTFRMTGASGFSSCTPKLSLRHIQDWVAGWGRCDTYPHDFRRRGHALWHALITPSSGILFLDGWQVQNEFPVGCCAPFGLRQGFKLGAFHSIH